ncbi:hypothetical protein PBI_SOUPS_62 [Gordonia phage Soups]|uniref:Uncharacterized protein n=1 Tax=Gordonia phage Soups TaxID=1838079 RepID=A0A166YD01_9CAUD|nr:nucleotide kinase [Gordonia phage Soups]ANA86997.1 hypothetical protein PBI_SOUPS_62 [Gordonia phage Soups]
MTETRVHVEHYASTEIETIDFIADKLGPEGFKAYVLGNILKYASRAQFKGVFDDDLEKIRNYSVILQERQAKPAAAAEPRQWARPEDAPEDVRVFKISDDSNYLVIRADGGGWLYWDPAEQPIEDLAGLGGWRVFDDEELPLVEAIKGVDYS